ncbi:DegT/DnrJ/EryC1/StrS family aminotransferase [Cyclobacterium jeungdonense]|uniref:DegT/DnrJ/EryC1/StrS family aminotransferase n=1 Tax=Cyclobacterium jeungdonense TaxID=708087 RepID=A0ABT8C8T6_9BACT|nr:DegT/DnrJ/EryC1/StrS family aminotransferase [Cyclobacterium jeungdonense]MDN3688940.1 DegT/DnrJ/EryC1/StrS family aminotransferase [Cyclobacterium jeungdonense]
MTPTNRIKFQDLQALNDRFEPLLSQRILEVIQSGQYVVGEQIREFEKEFCAFTGIGHTIGVSNGTNALELILRAYLEMGRIQKNDEILVPANTFIATFLAIVSQGLVPVPIDPEIPSFLPTADALEKKITPKTKGLVMVHLYGRTAYSRDIAALLDSKGMLLIEDNAQAVGSQFEGRKTGSLGGAAAHSFFPTKNLGALGDAGAVTTDDQELATIIRALAHYGRTGSHCYTYAGTNYRMAEIQAAALRVKLPHLDQDNNRRMALANTYLRNISHPDILLPKPENLAFHHTWHLFTILTKKRQHLVSYLDRKGIETAIHYATPPHRQPAFRNSMRHRSLPVTEKIHRETLSLPLYPTLSDKNIRYIIDTVNGW